MGLGLGLPGASEGVKYWGSHQDKKQQKKKGKMRPSFFSLQMFWQKVDPLKICAVKKKRQERKEKRGVHNT